MRWAKHLTTARHDEKMALLLDAHGPAGYGVYWLIVEIIGEKVTDDRTKVTYPEKFWRKNLGVSGQKLKVFLDFFAKSKLFSVEICGNIITIDCPNILKYRDEYTNRLIKKSGHCPDTVGSLSSSDTETDTETDTDSSGRNILPEEDEDCVSDETLAPSDAGASSAPAGNGAEPGSDQPQKPGQMPKAAKGESPDEYHQRYMAWARDEITRLKEAKRGEWALAFPAADPDRECARAAVWLDSNPKKRKKSIPGFIARWLSQTQERGLVANRGSPPPKPTWAEQKQAVTINAVNKILEDIGCDE